MDELKTDELRKKSGCYRCSHEMGSIFCGHCIGYVPYGGEPVEKDFAALYFPKEMLSLIESFLQVSAIEAARDSFRFMMSEEAKQMIDFCQKREWKEDNRPK